MTGKDRGYKRQIEQTIAMYGEGDKEGRLTPRHPAPPPPTPCTSNWVLPPPWGRPIPVMVLVSDLSYQQVVLMMMIIIMIGEEGTKERSKKL